jgi:hypothetical protein
MTSAYDLLLKFVINLLKPNRPPVWRSIKTNNTAFRARVACMRGYEDILKTAGYTEKKEDSLQFPESVQEPDKQKLYVIAAELLMARLEVDKMNPASQSQQQQQLGEGSLRQPSPANQRRAQTALVASTTCSGNGMGVGGGSRDFSVGSNQLVASQQGQNYSGGIGGIGGAQAQQQLLQQQPSYHHQQHQPQQYSSRTAVHGGGYGYGPAGASFQSVGMQPGYRAEQSAMQQQQQQQQRQQEMPKPQQLQLEPQLGYQSSYQQESRSALRQEMQQPVHHNQNQPRDTPREDPRAHGQQWHRSQSDDSLSSSQLTSNGSTRAVSTENL